MTTYAETASDLIETTISDLTAAETKSTDPADLAATYRHMIMQLLPIIGKFAVQLDAVESMYEEILSKTERLN